MTISSTTNRVAYTGNGATTAFSFPYAFFAQADLVVISTIIATGVQTTKALTTDYTISGTVDSLGHYSSGGTVTAVTAPASTVTWTIYRDPAATQTTDLVANDALPAESLEAAFDYQSIVNQRTREIASRSLLQPEGDSATIGRLPAKVTRASKYLAFDADGDPVVAAGTSETPNVLLKTGGNLTGGINEFRSNITQHATTMDLFAVTSPAIRDGAGSAVTITAIVNAPQAGAKRRFYPLVNTIITHGATFSVDGNATYTTLTGDCLEFEAITVSTFDVHIIKQDGTAIASLMDAPSAQDFRFSLSTGVPVTTSDVTAAGTIYAVPYKGNRIGLYNGTKWNVRSSAQFSLALTATSGSAYDVFIYDNAGVPTLELSAAWNSTTTRFASGSYATLLPMQDGIKVKSTDGTAVDATRRYFGSFYANGTNTTEDSVANRYVDPYDYPVTRPMRRLETTASWTNTGTTIRQANAAAANQLNFFIGVSEEAVSARVISTFSHNSGSHGAQIFIGLNSTTAAAADSLSSGVMAGATVTLALNASASYVGFPGIGKHYLAWLETSTSSGTTTFVGAGTAPNLSSLVQSGIIGEIRQ